MNDNEVRNIVEASLMVAQRPLSLDSLLGLFGEAGRPERGEIREAIEALRQSYEGRGIELVEVASGYRIQVRQQLSEWVSRLWQERPPRYSRALLETLSLIAYRQPITRGEIEDIRGVSVSTNIMRTLLDRGWVRVLGTRDVPGKPAMYGTTREFLDYFGLKRLDDLPSLAELRDIDSINVELDLPSPDDIAESPSNEADAEPAGSEFPEDVTESPSNEADAEPEGPEYPEDVAESPSSEVDAEPEGSEFPEDVSPIADSAPDEQAGGEDEVPTAAAAVDEDGEHADGERTTSAIDENPVDDEAGADKDANDGAEPIENRDDADVNENDRAAVVDLPASR